MTYSHLATHLSFTFIHCPFHPLSPSYSTLFPLRDLVYPSLYWCSYNFSLLILLASSTTLLLIHVSTNLTLHSTTWWSEMPCPIPLTALTSCTKCTISFFTKTKSIIFFTSTSSWPLATLVYLGKLLYLKYVPYTQPPFNTELHHASPMFVISWNSKAPVILVLTLSPIPPFWSPSMYNLYSFPTLSRTSPFLHQLFHWGCTPSPHKL